jgi:hypothetical protein
MTKLLVHNEHREDNDLKLNPSLYRHLLHTVENEQLFCIPVR